ncbi:hypothetical protein PIB30_085712 [Stylosanthes scabra]|uniref:RNase H type-1 domain-containing protein n=1 Tax=Stylosanthes scabra TaxID=79078 RepID=A0ABU6ZRP3_9FABA|nr:hypothetical protein [Stylosanthes scabra]
MDSQGKLRRIVDIIAEIRRQFPGEEKRNDSGNRHVGWQSPLENLTKVNTDGASRGNPGLVSSASVARDTTVDGFGVLLMLTNRPKLLRWRSMPSKKRLKSLGIRESVTSLLKLTYRVLLRNPPVRHHSLMRPLKKINELIRRNWRVEIKHVLREANQEVADGLANKILKDRLEATFYEQPPMEVHHCLFAYAYGNPSSSIFSPPIFYQSLVVRPHRAVVAAAPLPLTPTTPPSPPPSQSKSNRKPPPPLTVSLTFPSASTRFAVDSPSRRRVRLCIPAIINSCPSPDLRPPFETKHNSSASSSSWKGKLYLLLLGTTADSLV